MITPAQCRAARTLLSWSVGKLASAASLSENAVHDFELEREPLDAPTADALRRAFEDVGVEFLPYDDVRLRADPPAVR
jgi:transcriptional regulator with XRE-family HTH domain